MKISHNLDDTWDTPDTIYSNPSMNNLEFSNYADTLLLTFGAGYHPGNADEVFVFRSSDAGSDPGANRKSFRYDDSCTSYEPHIAINESGNVAVCWAASGGNYNSDLLIRLSHDMGLSWDSTLIDPQFNGWVDFDIAYTGDTLHLSLAAAVICGINHHRTTARAGWI